MAKEQKISAAKQARLQVVEQLQQTLPGLREILGEDEFSKRIKKAAKLLAAGVKSPARKKEKRKIAEDPEASQAA